MRQAKLLALMIILTLLTACSPSITNIDKMAEIRTDFIAAERLELTASLTADYGDRVYDFRVKYTGDSQKGKIEILAPESIAGITAEVDISGVTLVYDDARMETGRFINDGLSPVEAIPMLISGWQKGIIKLLSEERLDSYDTLSMTTDITEPAQAKTWFDKNTLIPIRSEISENGKMVIQCKFENVIVE